MALDIRGASTAALSTTFAPIDTQRLRGGVVPIGDSLVRGAEFPPTAGATALDGAVGGSWSAYAATLSGGKIRHLRNAGFGGNTSANMIARFDTDVTPYAPNVVPISAGTNDSNGGVAPGQFRDNILTLIAKVHAIGALPVLVTVPPISSAGATQRRLYGQYNLWLTRYASKTGIPLVDFYNLLADPVTGNLLALYNSGDGTHPNDLGYKAMGQLFSDVISPLIAATRPPFALSNTDPTNLLTNGMFIGDSNGDGLADGWTIKETPWGAGTKTRSIVTDAQVPGNLQRQALAGSDTGNMGIFQFLSTGFAPGDRLRASVLVTADTSGSPGGTLRYRLNVAPYKTGYVGLGETARFADTSVTRGLLELDFVVPPLTTDIEFRLYMESKAAPGATGTVDFGRAALVNLTAAGL